jgi:hypothetical protein
MVHVHRKRGSSQTVRICIFALQSLQTPNGTAHSNDSRSETDLKNHGICASSTFMCLPNDAFATM